MKVEDFKKFVNEIHTLLKGDTLYYVDDSLVIIRRRYVLASKAALRLLWSKEDRRNTFMAQEYEANRLFFGTWLYHTRGIFT